MTHIVDRQREFRACSITKAVTTVMEVTKLNNNLETPFDRISYLNTLASLLRYQGNM